MKIKPKEIVIDNINVYRSRGLYVIMDNEGALIRLTKESAKELADFIKGESNEKNKNKK